MDNKTTSNNTDGSKSSNKSNRKKQEISVGTFITSIERDINDLMQEISNRSQKNKLISMSGMYLVF